MSAESLTCCHCGRPFELENPGDPLIVCLPCAPEYFNPIEGEEEREFSRRFLAHTRAEMAFYAVVEEEGLDGLRIPIEGGFAV